MNRSRHHADRRAARGCSLLLALVLLVPSLLAAEHDPNKGEAPPIQDNSFLIEEAYNQDDGVVQHINAFTRLWQSKDWVYTFTQEWPGFTKPRNQYSYTVVAMSPGAYPGAGVGLGDAMLNYRYQLIGGGDSRLAFSPRVSALLPSGNSRLGRGFGGWGVQTMLPVSLVLNHRFVSHWNAGATFIPAAKDAGGDKAFSAGYTLGNSLIWLTKDYFNVMLENTFNASSQVVGPQRTMCVRSWYLNPGIRWAYNLNHKLQIVPGIAMPIGVGPSQGERGIFVYLSFEHPFKAPLEKK